VTTHQQTPDAWLDSISQAIQQHRTFPPMPANLTMAQAYPLQQQLTKKISGQSGIAGIKAGLTADAVKQYFGLDAPVIGSLYENGRLNPDCQVESIPGLMLECEIGVIIGDNKKPLALVPVIEIVFLKYAEPSDLTAANIVAANVGADRFICGEPRPWDQSSEPTEIVLKKDGETVCQASTHDSLGGPKQGSSWMIQEAHDRQFDVTEGMLLILGTCGPAVSADKGKYIASYGTLGNITFTVF